VNVGPYRFLFVETNDFQGPNYQGIQGLFQVFKQDKRVTQLIAKKKIYTAQQMPMTEAAIHAGFWHDLYIALGEPLQNGQAWSVRIYYKPFVRWIWLGGLCILMGGLLALMDKRYRSQKIRSISSQSIIQGASDASIVMGWFAIRSTQTAIGIN